MPNMTGCSLAVLHLLARCKQRDLKRNETGNSDELKTINSTCDFGEALVVKLRGALQRVPLECKVRHRTFYDSCYEPKHRFHQRSRCEILLLQSCIPEHAPAHGKPWKPSNYQSRSFRLHL